jgi:hypothetical protein
MRTELKEKEVPTPARINERRDKSAHVQRGGMEESERGNGNADATLRSIGEITAGIVRRLAAQRRNAKPGAR